MKRSGRILSLYHPVEKALLCNTDLRQNKHFLFPGLNLCDEKLVNIETAEDAFHSYESFDFCFGYPLPCLSPAFISEEVMANDHVLKHVKEKYIWKKNKERWVSLARTASRGKRSTAKIFKCIKENEPITVLPYIVAKLSNHLSKNTDKYLKGAYNWYYGNTIAVANICNNLCLLFAGGKNLSELCISTFNKENGLDSVPIISPKINLSLQDGSPIFDIVPSKSKELLGVRQRNRCSFFFYGSDEDNDIVMNKCMSVSMDKYPFISMDTNGQEFCTINANRELYFWTPDYFKYNTGNFVLPNSDSFLSDNFAQVKYNNEEYSYIYNVIDRANIYIYDKRQNSIAPVLSWNTKNFIEMCESSSLLIPSLIANYWYVGFTHSCLLLDVRAGFVQKWTHMLPQTPSVGCTFGRNKASSSNINEMAFLGTQTTNSTVAIRNKWNEGKPVYHYFPKILPNKIKMLHEAHLNGYCTNTNLQNKFSRSLIGMTTYKKGSDSGIFTLVSSGDIFYQGISKKRKLDNTNHSDAAESVLNNSSSNLSTNELNYLSSWEKKCTDYQKMKKSALTVTDNVDMTNLIECLNIESNENYHWNYENTFFKFKFKKTKKDLESCGDFLAPWILQDFGLDESDWQYEHFEKPRNFQNVEHWLSELNGVAEGDVSELFKDGRSSIFPEVAEYSLQL